MFFEGGFELTNRGLRSNTPINQVPEAGPTIAKSVHCVRSTRKRDMKIITRACFIKVRVAAILTASDAASTISPG